MEILAGSKEGWSVLQRRLRKRKENTLWKYCKVALGRWDCIASCRTKKSKKKKKKHIFWKYCKVAPGRWWECIASCRTGLVRDKEEPSYY